jgi:hypothetical protein
MYIEDAFLHAYIIEMKKNRHKNVINFFCLKNVFLAKYFKHSL